MCTVRMQSRKFMNNNDDRFLSVFRSVCRMSVNSAAYINTQHPIVHPTWSISSATFPCSSRDDCYGCSHVPMQLSSAVLIIRFWCHVVLVDVSVVLRNVRLCCQKFERAGDKSFDFVSSTLLTRLRFAREVMALYKCALIDWLIDW